MFYYVKKDLRPYLQDYKPIYISYILRMQMTSPSLIVFDIILERKAHMTLTPGSRANIMAPNESPYMISYMPTIQVEPQSLVVLEIFE